MYVPPDVITQIHTIKIEDGIHSNAEAMRKMVNYSNIGREIDNIRHRFLFRDKKKKYKQNGLIGGGFI